MPIKKTRRDREARKKLAFRIGALILALLMIGSSVYLCIYFLIIGLRAATYDSTADNISVGLIFGDDVDYGFTVFTTRGFTVGKAVVKSSQRTYEELWTLDGQRTVTVLIDTDLAKSYSAYSPTNYAASVVIGAYHIELGYNLSSRSELESISNTMNSYLSGTGYYVIPAFINGYYRIRIGHFANSAAAQSALSSLTALTSRYDALRIVSPSSTGVTVVDPGTDKVLFEYDCLGNSDLGMLPLPAADGSETYTKTPANNIYDGVFVYKRYTANNNDGIEVINLLGLEDYLLGVLPWEISNSWSFEVQRVFAIAARTYAIRNYGRHMNEYGFDLCNNTNCQAYLGLLRVNNNVRSAVSSTEEMVVSYNGSLAPIYYTAISGGETVSSQEAWGGGAYPYLTSMKTPWEQYTDYSMGLWTREVSGYDLCSYLKGKGYAFSGTYISQIRINSTAAGTGYVNSLTLTDNYGSAVTITHTDAVRGALTKYLPSSNFVVGVGKVTYSYEVVTNIEAIMGGAAAVPTGPAYPGLFDEIGLSGFTAYTTDGKLKAVESDVLVALTGSGRRAITGDSVSILSSDGNKKLEEMIENGTMPEPSNTTQTPVEGGTGSSDVIINATTKAMTDTAYASVSTNFIFAGKGWGHGVGISQYGAMNLANAGVSAEYILRTYLPGTSVSHKSTLGY